MKKLTQQNIELILLLLIVIVAAAAYKFGYLDFADKAAAVDKETKAIEARIALLDEKETHREEQTAVINGANEAINNILALYGPGNTPEKSIMFIRELETNCDMEVPSISFSVDTPIYTSSRLDENGLPLITAYSTDLVISYNTTYDGLKKCMKYINSYKEYMNVSDFTAVVDPETGGISGTMSIKLYSVEDANHEYKDPTVSGIRLGTDNIFKSAH